MDYELLGRAINASKKEQEAKEQAENAYSQFMKTVPDCFFPLYEFTLQEEASEEQLELIGYQPKFWEVMGVFQRELDRPSFPVKRAIDELCRKVHAQEKCGYKWIDLFRFIKGYQSLSHYYYKHFFDIVEGYGDDGYSDLMDVLPVVGESFYNKHREITNNAEFAHEVVAAIKDTFKYVDKDKILNCEGYFSTRLDEEVCSRLYGVEF